MNTDGQADIERDEQGASGVLTLNRERALNALNRGMVNSLSAALDDWQDAPNIHHILLRGRGRAFCAGGDLMDVYREGKAGNPHFGFFRDEYRLNARLGVFPKPIIALVDGIIMGGGVGIAVHGRFLVMTENALFSMPEAGIGFFPDVGGSHFLPRLPGHMGTYLGLTGARIRAADAHAAGIATHIVPADRLADLTRILSETGDAESVLADYHDPAVAGPPRLDQQDINRLFAAETLEGIVEALERECGSNETAAAALKAMRRNSPTSQAVTVRQIREGRSLSLADCMRMEYRILVRMLHGVDFYEGIRAVIVDKTNDPKWSPSRLEDVDQAEVDAYFSPLGADELKDVPERP